MQLSVIILNYNVRYFLEQCVLSVQKALENIDGEIIVVDNLSTDDSCAMMKTRFPNVKLIENKANLGFPKGNNIGVAEAKGEYLCILNPDTVVAEDTFEKILNTKNWQLNTGIIGCKLIDGTGNFLPESKRGVPTPWVAFTKIFGLYKFFPKSSFFNKYYAQHLSENQTGKVDILVGAFMVMKRDVYLEVGGFDENCFMYSDDIDLSYMVLKSGKSNYYFHETSVIHYKGESTVRDGTYMKRFREAMQFFYKKHFGGSVVFDVLMRMGAFAFSVLKKSQQKQVVYTIAEYVLISSDENLKNKLENQLQKKVTRFNEINENALFSQANFSGKNLEILLDNNSFSFQEIIAFLEQNKNRGYTFKIIPEAASFMIGSNSSNDRGEIIEIA
ncbi:glycosyl transferase, group 2 family protein [Flavobacterium cauense R2A-7]|uniref:GT2 family glycosyltransferase n=1 Tax=Flavobacterium cauense R2A-7 TaxID=1341154 RepID=V6S8B5_9FLAO|nr:glycosyltransferase family 2 protein [Flavobacterium cauense]ESU20635.1 glycosyl transferase, group 2 family protein [Flavobacterium cauense R2A-7]KGO82984.1 glycosyl transferase family 2 [Flavobacterium cauense R2A-7]TWI10734.1 GT2 family glycosyltransferase [Flavobacterium cauense R2A-7]